MSGKESEALCLLAEKHCRKVSMSETHLTVISDRTWDTECLKTDTDSLSGLCSVLASFLQSDGSSYYICPFRILEADRLRIFASLIRIKTILLANGVSLFDILDTVFVKGSENLFDSWLSNLTSLIIIVFLLILYVGQCI